MKTGVNRVPFNRVNAAEAGNKYNQGSRLFWASDRFTEIQAFNRNKTNTKTPSLLPFHRSSPQHYVPINLAAQNQCWRVRRDRIIQRERNGKHQIILFLFHPLSWTLFWFSIPHSFSLFLIPFYTHTHTHRGSNILTDICMK